MSSKSAPKQWSLPFLDGLSPSSEHRTIKSSKTALIILNQPLSLKLLECLWTSAHWVACADGGANRLFDVFAGHDQDHSRSKYLPNLIKGDLDSLRDDVAQYYDSQSVKIERDTDQDSTDLMKCVSSLHAKERQEGDIQYDLIILGGLSGRLDHTIHTLSYLHKLRKSRERVFAITDENVAWVLDSGEHEIQINHAVLGPTCGLLPVGDSTVLSTNGLRWNLTEHESSFDGLVSTSNHLSPDHPTVRIKTTKPIWWTMELR